MNRNIHTAAGSQERNSQWQSYWKENKFEVQPNNYEHRPYLSAQSNNNGYEDNESNSFNQGKYEEAKYNHPTYDSSAPPIQSQNSLDPPYTISLLTARSGRSVNLMNSGERGSARSRNDTTHDNQFENQLHDSQLSEELYFPVEHVDGDEHLHPHDSSFLEEENEVYIDDGNEYVEDGDGYEDEAYEDFDGRSDIDGEIDSARSSVIEAFLAKQHAVQR
jgi:hypothetical protein